MTLMSIYQGIQVGVMALRSTYQGILVGSNVIKVHLTF